MLFRSGRKRCCLVPERQYDAVKDTAHSSNQRAISSPSGPRFGSSFFSWLQNHMENTPQGEFGENKSQIKTLGKIKPKIKFYGHFSALLRSFLPRRHALKTPCTHLIKGPYLPHPDPVSGLVFFHGCRITWRTPHKANLGKTRVE